MRAQFFLIPESKCRLKTCIDLNAKKWNGCQGYFFSKRKKVLSNKVLGILRGFAKKKEIPDNKRLDCFFFSKGIF